MGALLLWSGRAAGIAGLVVCAIASVVRVSGHYYLGGFQLATLLQVGIAAMIAGCLCFLMLLTKRAQ